MDLLELAPSFIGFDIGSDCVIGLEPRPGKMTVGIDHHGAILFLMRAEGEKGFYEDPKKN
ncbi:MAG: hypothetical protein WAO55_02535 [Candidatus Manganitrophaceae bacterium]